MSQAGKNLKYLRKLRGWTQQEYANKLKIKRSLVGAYEEERAEPRLDVLEKLSKMFHLTLDELLLEDVAAITGDDYLSKRRLMKMNSAERNLIHFVPVKAAAGYLAGYGDNEFIDELNTFTLPMIKGNNMRAFEIVGDSMLPTPSGSIIVGEKVESLGNVKNNTACIVVTTSEGIVYKRILKNNRIDSKVTLMSDNPAFHPYQVMKEDVLELWEAKVVVNKVEKYQRWDVNSLVNLVSDLQDKVTSLQRRVD